jgi:hypothetical protein
MHPLDGQIIPKKGVDTKTERGAGTNCRKYVKNSQQSTSFLPEQFYSFYLAPTPLGPESYLFKIEVGITIKEYQCLVGNFMEMVNKYNQVRLYQ